MVQVSRPLPPSSPYHSNHMDAIGVEHFCQTWPEASVSDDHPRLNVIVVRSNLGNQQKWYWPPAVGPSDCAQKPTINMLSGLMGSEVKGHVVFQAFDCFTACALSLLWSQKSQVQSLYIFDGLLPIIGWGGWRHRLCDFHLSWTWIKRSHSFLMQQLHSPSAQLCYLSIAFHCTRGGSGNTLRKSKRHNPVVIPFLYLQFCTKELQE